VCGIVGEIAGERPIQQQRFEGMVATLASRGPDGTGFRRLDDGRVALGHTRLSIIDLSDAGRQPLTNEDASVWLVFNGEIYNYRELRNELIGAGHRFRSASDSEVIVHAYEEWGDDCVTRLRGIFAFGLWDARRRRLFAARDRLGVKPLYLWPRPDGLVFASQPRAILAHPEFRAEVDVGALQHYLALGYVPGDLSIYAGVRKLPAAHTLVAEPGRAPSIERYWELRPSCDVRDPDEAVELVRGKLVEAVETQLVSDVPVGCFLSGGVDSATVAAIAASRGESALPSFTLGFSGADDELPRARLTAERLGCDAHERVLSLEAALASIPDFIAATDEPLYDHSGLPLLAVSRLARERGVKVVLSGDGGDEVFAGYPWYPAFLDRPQLPLSRRIKRRLLFRGPADPMADYFRWMGFLDGRAQRGLLPRAPHFDHVAPFARHHRRDLPEITALQLTDLNTFLADDVLVKVDRTSMACGVEVRVPLLDHELVEAVFSVDPEVVFAGGEPKSLLKRAVAGWVAPELLSAEKKGFGIPIAAWMDARLLDRVEPLVADGSLVARGVFDASSVRALLAERRPRPAWLLLVAELWARHWLEGEDPADSPFAPGANAA
jgi:asparagine synthase (glutamine-hydrolysing)